MFDEIKQSVEVEASPKPVGFERWLGKRVVYQAISGKLNGTIESCYLDDRRITFYVLTDDGDILKAYIRDLTIMQS